MNRKDFFKTLIGIGIGSQVEIKPKEILEEKKNIFLPQMQAHSNSTACLCSFPDIQLDSRKEIQHPFRKL